MIQIAICDDSEVTLQHLNQSVNTILKSNQEAAAITLYSSSESLSYDIEEGHFFDLILTDIEMPDMNGLELSHRLMEYPNIQKIFFSSYSNYEYFRAALQNGVADYLMKRWPTAPCWNALKRSKHGWMPAAPCRKPPPRPITTRSCTMCSNT